MSENVKHWKIHSLKELAKLGSIQGTELKTQIEHFIDGDFVGLTKDQRFHYILGGANSLLNYRIISEDDFYSIEKILEKVAKNTK